MRRKLLLFICLGVLAAAIGASVALAGNYAGPKTWLPNYDADSSYSTSWTTDSMYSKSCGNQSGCDARVTFIDGVGNWHASYTDNLPATTTFDFDNSYSKKAYCKNNSALTYTATCEVLAQ